MIPAAALTAEGPPDRWCACCSRSSRAASGVGPAPRYSVASAAPQSSSPLGCSWSLPAATGHGFGFSVTEAGLFLLPSTIGMIIFGPVSGAMDLRHGARTPLIAGTVVAAASFALPTLAHHATWQLLAASALMGVGVGFDMAAMAAMAAMANAIIAAVPPKQTGVATGVSTLTRTVGGSIGTAAVATILTANTTDGGIPTDDAFTYGFVTGLGVLVLALLAALLLPSPRTFAR